MVISQFVKYEKSAHGLSWLGFFPPPQPRDLDQIHIDVRSPFIIDQPKHTSSNNKKHTSIGVKNPEKDISTTFAVRGSGSPWTGSAGWTKAEAYPQLKRR
jgi:hypothetical protein